MKTNSCRISVLAVIIAALLAASLLLALVGTKPAEAAFQNGKIAFQSNRTTGEGVDNQDGDFEIFTINADGSGLTQLTKNNAADISPDWSPDGKKIAFESARDGNFEVYVMDAKDRDGDGNGDNPTNLTNNPVPDGNPAWSPNGKKIAFQSFDRHRVDSEIFTMNADGSSPKPTNLTKNTAFDFTPTWSPNGKKIAFSSNDEVFVMTAEGEKQKNLTNSPESEVQPTWSPDGMKIAFVIIRFRDDHYETDVYVMDKDGSNRIPLTNNLGDDRAPDFSPDATKMVFHSNRDSNSEVYVMDAEDRDGDGNGDNPINLSDNPASDEQPDWQTRPN